jgi:hypothetical protein
MTGDSRAWRAVSAAIIPVMMALVLAACGSTPPPSSTSTTQTTSGTSHSSTPSSTTVPKGPSPSTKISFHVEGNAILESNGQRYVPYGFVLWCLADPNLSCESGPDSDSQKIVAAADYWHANTVRLQVAWEHLFSGPGGSFDQSYLRMLDDEVDLANRHHMVVIVTLQTERYKGSLLPDSNALRFWKFMAVHFKRNPMVFFDLFNEPRLTGTPSTVWKVWRNGGNVATPTGRESFVGMQQLVDAIRGEGADNVVVAEGIQKDHMLAGLPPLKGSNIAYGTEPSLRQRGQVHDVTPSQWQQNWGSLSQRYPVMMEAFIDTPGSDACNPNSPALVPELLSFLAQHHLGLIYFSMEPGLAIVGNDLTEPTSFSGSTYDCSATPTTNTQGPGQDILDWFRQNSRPIG